MTTKRAKREAGERRAQEQAQKDAVRRAETLRQVQAVRARQQRAAKAEAARRNASANSQKIRAMFPNPAMDERLEAVHERIERENNPVDYEDPHGEFDGTRDDPYHDDFVKQVESQVGSLADLVTECADEGPIEATSLCVLRVNHSGDHEDNAGGTWQ